ncbi:MAG: protein kinase [Planctomycetota bacterium]
MGITRFFLSLARFLEAFLFLPARFCLKSLPIKGLFFTFTFLNVLGICSGVVFPELWWLLPLMFWLELSFSFLNHRVHQQKREVIEGTCPEAKADLLSYSVALTKPILFLTHFFLLVTLILLLRQATLLWGDTLFSSSSLTLEDWSLYALDLVLKAVLFDIPEIYHLEFSEINHTGFWGGTLVFISRLIILVLIVGSLLRLREIRQLVLQSVHMLGHASVMGENRLLLTLKMYPSQIKRLSRWCLNQKIPNLPYVSLVEVLGKVRQPLILPMLEKLFTQHPLLEMRLSALRAMEHLGQGNPEILKPLLQGQEANLLLLQQQACRNLGIWKTPQSLQLLKESTNPAQLPQIRLSAIEALGLTQQIEVVPFLIKIMLQDELGKEERFASKEAILKIKLLDQEMHQQLAETLKNSPHPDNRRFASMILGGLENIEDLKLYKDCLKTEKDVDTAIYLLKAIGSVSYLVGKLEQNMESSNLYLSSLEWKELFEQIKTMAMSHEKGFVRVAAIQTLVDLSWLLTKNILRESDLVPDLEALAQNKDTQVSDAASDALLRLSQQLHNLELNRRRESITAIGMEDLSWRPKTEAAVPSSLPRPTVPFLPTHKKSSAISKFATTIQPGAQHLPEISELLPTLPVALIGRYEIQKVLHHGKLAMILQVKDTRDGKEKVLKCTVSSETKTQELFLRELDVLRTCKHPGIIPLLEEHQSPESVAFTMPWWDCPNLFQAQNTLKSEKKLWSLDDFEALMRSLCEALIYLHQSGWYHGDLKPENILYVQGKSVLIDFNSTQKIKEPSELLAGGTPYYMAPEQVNQGNCDLKVDIYSLGIIAYELLTGSLPLGLPPIPIHTLRFDVPELLYPILSKASHFHAKERFESVSDFLESLQNVLH